MPAEQDVQVPIAVAPIAVEYVPARHSSHCVAADSPGVDDHRPAPHGTITGPPGQYEPAEQDTHVPATEAPTKAENVPAEHVTHTFDDAPVAVEYVPATHSVHSVMVMRPVDDDHRPAGQPAIAEPPAQKNPAVHVVHVPGTDAPTKVDRVPPEHVTHVLLDAPTVVEYSPATHSVHPVAPLRFVAADQRPAGHAMIDDPPAQ